MPDLSKNLMKSLWLEKLPDSMRNIILVSDKKKKKIPKLVIMADKISDMTPFNEICGISTANNCLNTELLMKIQSLKQQISQLTIHHISRPKYRNNSEYGRPSRSNSILIL